MSSNCIHLQDLPSVISGYRQQVESQLAALPSPAGTDAQTVSETKSTDSPAQTAFAARSTGSVAQQGSGLTAIEQLLAEEEQQTAAKQAKKQKQKAKKQRQREQQQQLQQVDKQVQHIDEQQQQQPQQPQQQLVEQDHQGMRQSEHLPGIHDGEAEEQNSVHSLAAAFSGLRADEPCAISPAARMPCLPIVGVGGTEAGKDGGVQDESLPESSSSSASSLQELFCCPLSKVML